MSPILRLRRRLYNLTCAFVALGLVLVQTRHHYASLRNKVPPSLGYAAAALLFVLLYRKVWAKTDNSTLPPRVKGWLPGNLDILWQLVKGESNEYCANTLRRWEQTYGPTYDMNILWSHQACIFLPRFTISATFKTM